MKKYIGSKKRDGMINLLEEEWDMIGKEVMESNYSFKVKFIGLADCWGRGEIYEIQNMAT